MTKKDDSAELTLDGVPLGFSDADLARDIKKIVEDIEVDHPMKAVIDSPLDTMISVEESSLPDVGIPDIELMLAKPDHL
ncbi:hypothetical protein [Methylobacterium sp. B4]|uniref:hypothetical protein n=1 Tax=Methylobacterium sp. B4 TaxID=1938755 RepID=UPI000D76DCC4|nr:hypothetical protein [Methylobacterium sp. B4]PXW57732.1 hypothetical protein BY998_1139 [Methylobacterium sp. B4]